MKHTLLIERENLVDETESYEIVDTIPKDLRWARRKLQDPLFEKMVWDNGVELIRVHRYEDTNAGS